MDRDAKFSASFRNARVCRRGGRDPALASPNLNSHLERFFGSLRAECLDRLIFFGEESLRRAVKSYVAHYHQERSHQGLGNRLISPGDEAGRAGSIAASVWVVCFATTIVAPRDRCRAAASSRCLPPHADHAFRPTDLFCDVRERHDLGRICLSIAHTGPLPGNDLRFGEVFLTARPITIVSWAEPSRSPMVSPWPSGPRRPRVPGRAYHHRNSCSPRTRRDNSRRWRARS